MRLLRIVRLALAAAINAPRQGPITGDDDRWVRVAGAVTDHVARMALVLLLVEVIAGPFDVSVRLRAAIVVGAGLVSGVAVEGFLAWLATRPRRIGSSPT